MAKQKTIPELEAEKSENERKLSQLQHKKQQIENRITYYEKGGRHKRAHYLITRGAAIESVAPLTKVMCINRREFAICTDFFRHFAGDFLPPCRDSLPPRQFS